MLISHTTALDMNTHYHLKMLLWTDTRLLKLTTKINPTIWHTEI